MRNTIVRATVAACLIGGASLAIAFSTGPVPSRTGAPAVGPIPGEPNCTVCHNTYGAEVNNPLGLLEILDVPATYSSGQVIPIRLRLSYAHDPIDSIAPYKWGFQLTAVQANSGQGVGTFIPDLHQKLVVPPGTSVWKTRRYVEHMDSTSTHTGAVGPVEWTILWTAPAVDSGAIYFFAAGNAADGDGDHTNDHIYTARDTIAAGGLVGVPPRNYPALAFSSHIEPPFPNPFNRCVDLDFEIARTGTMDLSIFDLQGRHIRTIYRGEHAMGPGAFFWDGNNDDGSKATNGIYFVRLKAPGEARAYTRKLTLAR